MMKNTVLGFVVFVMLGSVAQAQAGNWDRTRVECGDHWKNVSVDVSWPVSLMSVGGDSGLSFWQQQVSTLVVEGLTADSVDFYFQALDGVNLGLHVRSTDGVSAVGELVEPSGEKTSMECSLERAPVL
jgi:hypothetical protein